VERKQFEGNNLKAYTNILNLSLGLNSKFQNNLIALCSNYQIFVNNVLVNLLADDGYQCSYPIVMSNCPNHLKI